jgi:hypothetical protein
MASNESDSITGRREPWSVLRRIPLSDAVLNVSYWCTVVLVAGVGGYVFHWRWTHPVIPAVADDPWGITTPPWMVEVFFSLLMFGYLAEACRQALCGNRKWNSIAIAALVMVAAGLTQKLGALMTAK